MTVKLHIHWLGCSLWFNADKSRFSFMFIDLVVVCRLMRTYHDGRFTLLCISWLSHANSLKDILYMELAAILFNC